jgi:hypothetical protein
MVRRTDRLPLQVRVSFEATRFGPHHLIEAYSPRTGGATDAPAAQRQQCSAAQDEGSDSNSARR